MLGVRYLEPRDRIPGELSHTIAEKYRVTERTINNWIRRRRKETGGTFDDKVVALSFANDVGIDVRKCGTKDDLEELRKLQIRLEPIEAVPMEKTRSATVDFKRRMASGQMVESETLLKSPRPQFKGAHSIALTRRRSFHVRRDVITTPIRKSGDDDARRRLDRKGEVTCSRGYGIGGGRLEYKVKIENNTEFLIANVNVTVAAYPDDCLRLEGEKTRVAKIVEPGGFVSLEFTFTPSKDCIRGTIQSAASYTDHTNILRVVIVEPQEVRSVCDLLQPFETTFEGLVSTLDKMDGTYEEKTVPWNGQVLFRLLDSLLSTNNFYKVQSEVQIIAGQFVGTIKGTAVGKYTRKKVAALVTIVGPADGHDACMRIAVHGEDTSMVPVTILEFRQGLKEMLALAHEIKSDTEYISTGFDFLTESVTLLTGAAGESIATCQNVQSLIEDLKKRTDVSAGQAREFLLMAVEKLEATSTGQETLQEALDDLISRIQLVSRKLGIGKSKLNRLEDAAKKAVGECAKNGVGAGIWFMVKNGLEILGVSIP